VKEVGMADRVLFIGWGETVRGREERALEVFNETVGLYGRMQQDGRIEKFDVCLLDPHGGGLGGFVALHGSAEQLAAVQADAEFRRNMADATLIVDELGVVPGAINEGVAEEVAMYQAAIAKVPQSA
jgi:hypothetical protein